MTYPAIGTDRVAGLKARLGFSGALTAKERLDLLNYVELLEDLIWRSRPCPYERPECGTTCETCLNDRYPPQIRELGGRNAERPPEGERSTH